jgi:CDP-glucose 4,6-dehydratase
LEIIQNFWLGKRVFLTGHTGFKGSWLSLWLQSLGAEVTGYALQPPTNPSLFEVANIKSGMRSVMGDICDLNLLQKTLMDVKPEIVIHMAAQSLVRYSYTNPVETYATNVMGTVSLLEAIKCIDTVKALVNVTSDKCYENREWIWSYREDEKLGGYDPYSNSKSCAELITNAYRSSFFNPEKYETHGLAIASARAGNVIGGGDWSNDRIIPDFFRSILLKETLLIRNPNAIRPWQHVLEPLSGYLLLAEKLFLKGVEYGQAWNFGPDDKEDKTVDWICDYLVRVWGNGSKYEIDKATTTLHEANFLKLDSSKARLKLHWQAKWSALQAIDKVCEWHKAYLDSEDMRAYSLNQIKQYRNT